MSSCPCGGGEYAACCAPLHRREREAATPEELMRSRYSAFVLGLGDHLFRTWHPRTRPDDLEVAPDPGWQELRVVDAPAPVGDHAEAEFVARHRDGTLHERSRFERRRGRWVYVDGEVARS